MKHTEFKNTVAIIITPIIVSCFYFGLKEPTLEEIVEMADNKCENIPNTDSARAYCLVNYVESYCNDHWKNKFCHEYQMGKLKKGT